LFAWNSVLGANGENCGTSLFANEYYCVGIALTITTTTPVTAPGPTQTGIVANCNKFAEAVAGDSCDALATRNKITDAQLFFWNSVLGANGQNCATLLFANEFYCVGVAPAATTTTPVTAPGPTQTGIVANCNKFAAVTAGSGCFDFAAANGITPAQLFAWNSILGVNGANCGTNLLADEYYCVGVSS
jgi:hypothetical protein